MAVFSEHQRQPEFCIFRADLAGHTAKRPARRRDEIIFLVMSVSILHGICNITLSWLAGQVPDSAIKRGGIY